MNQKKVESYGCWRSPITSELIVAGTIGLGGVAIDGQDIYWLEGRPSEGGRNVLVRRTLDRQINDVTPAPFNVRTRIHEYGGGSFLVVDRVIYFSNFADGRIYKQTSDSEPQALTEESKRCYGDLILDRNRSRLICVCEDHSQDNSEPENTIVSIDLNSGAVSILVSGDDFYSSPRLSPDGSWLAFISWNHPNMPWDETKLSLAKINTDGSLGETECVAGGKNESVCEPKWSPEGNLYFSSDRTGWWNLYHRARTGKVEPIYTMEAEFTYPHWVFGLSNYDFASESQIICSYTQNGSWHLASLNTETKQLTKIDLPYTDISSIQVRGDRLVCLAGSSIEPTAAIAMNIETFDIEILKRSSNLDIDPNYLSQPQAVTFPTENGLTAHAWYYPPQNRDYTAPEGELPPLLVKSHGGPTSAASTSFNLRVQYWTSRGFAYLDVNYGGSTGYGRQYRQRLENNWGIVDVDDCINAAQYLVDNQQADPNRLAISGGSAGGYTTLAALTFRDTFKAGASYYGVSDLEALVRDTHKFESRYLDKLVGVYPEEKAIYDARSPIYFTDRLTCPVAFFQGLEDKVVLPNQAEMMVEALKAKGLPVAYVAFAGEQHGFRRAENIKRALDGEFYFYSRIFDFQPGNEIEAIEIMNL
jgi:dipeptidyl aminopeptidase/acylaminoacyl peptidase